MSNWFLRTVQTFVVVSVIMMGYRTAAQFDGYFFPVITNVKLLESRPGSSNNETNVTTYTKISWTKTRECTYKKTEWYIGRPGKAILATSELLNPTDIPVLKGQTGITERLIRMSEMNFKENSYALVFHDCYNDWLWETVTVYWDSTETN